MSGTLGRWPPIRDQCRMARKQNQLKQPQAPPPFDETPLIKAIVDNIKTYKTFIMDIPDIALMIKKLQDYTFVSPLTNAIAEVSDSPSSNTKEDFDAIKIFYKEIDLIVWTYEFYKNHIASSNEGSAKPETSPLSSSLRLLSYPAFVEYIFESIIVPTIRQINEMNRSRFDVTKGDVDIVSDTNTIVDLILCGTDIPIPTSIYDLPKVLYDALHQTKYPPTKDAAVDSSSSTSPSSGLSLVYMNRNQMLRKNDKQTAKMHIEENKRYNMLYLYLLAHVAIHLSMHDAGPSNNMTSLSNQPPSIPFPNWKNTFTEISKCHPFSSTKSYSYIVPIILAIVQLDWYTHPTAPYSSLNGMTSLNSEGTSFAFSRYKLDVSLKSIVSDLLKDEYFNVLAETTHFHTYIIQSTLCERLFQRSDNLIEHPIDDPNEISVFSACYKLMTHNISLQSSYYQCVLVSLYRKQQKMYHLQHLSNCDATHIPDGAPLLAEHSSGSTTLPSFCVENDYPYQVHVLIFCYYGSQYNRAVQLVRSLCSGFMEQEITKSIGSNSGEIISGNVTNDVFDNDVLSDYEIRSLYASIFRHMLSNDYRFIFYNRDYYNYVYNYRVDHTIDFIIQIGTPPSWNHRYHSTPLEVFAYILQTFQQNVLDCTLLNNDIKEYMNLICQQVLLRIVFNKYKRYLTYIPSEFCRRVLPQNLLSILPSDVLSKLPTNQEYHHASEPRYVSIINSEIKRLISDEIAFPISWFGDNKPKRMRKKLSPEHDAQLDIYWAGILDKVCGSNAYNMDDNVDGIATHVATSGTSEETTRFVQYALSKRKIEKQELSATNGSAKTVKESIFDNITVMEPHEGTFINEGQRMSDVEMDDASVSEEQLTKSQIDDSADARQYLPPKQQTTTPTHDIDDDVDAAMYDHDDVHVNQYKSDVDDVYSETDEDDHTSDDDVEAEVYEEEDADENDEQEYPQPHFMGSKQDEAIDIDDDDDDDIVEDEDADDYSTNDDGNRDDGRLDGSTEAEMEVDDAAESDDNNEEGDDDHDTDASDENIDGGVESDIAYPQNTFLEGLVQHGPPTEKGTLIETTDSVSQNDQVNEEAEGKDNIEDPADEMEVEAININGGDKANVEHVPVLRGRDHDVDAEFMPSADSLNNYKMSDGTTQSNECKSEGQGIDANVRVGEVKLVGGDNGGSSSSVQGIDTGVGVVEKPNGGDTNSVHEINTDPFNPLEDGTRQILPNDELNSNSATGNTPDDMDIGSAAVENVDVKNVDAYGENVNQHDEKSTLQNLPADVDDSYTINYSTKQDDDFNAGPQYDDDIQISGLSTNVEMRGDIKSHDPSTTLPTGAESTKSMPINEIDPMNSATKSDLNSLRLPHIDSEAGYEAEDSQDAATDDDDNEFHHDSMTMDDAVLQEKRFPISSSSAAAQAAATSQLLVGHIAVSTLIDTGYEPDTQDGPTDVDFINVDPETGYEAEDSQDAGTEEENDDLHPNKAATIEKQMPRLAIEKAEILAPLNASKSHENGSTFIDQGYEPDPESQGQTDVDGVPQQTRHLESGYDGEESQCHTEDDIHTEDEHQMLPSESALPDVLQHDTTEERMHRQLIRPTASADGMIADDEMEAESSEVELADGGSSSLHVTQQVLNTHLSENNISQTPTGNLLTQIATSIQNEHSYDSPEKNHSQDLPNPQHDATAQMNEYIPQHMDGDDEDDDESSDSVRSKPGDEISCPMSDTHSSQSSVGMRSAAKSTASGELSQPNIEAVPISEIQTKNKLEATMLKEKKPTTATKIKRPTRSLVESATRASRPLKKDALPGVKLTADKSSPIMTRKRKAALQPGHEFAVGSEDTSIISEAKRRGRPPKLPKTISDNKNEPLPEKRSTRSKTATSTAVDDAQSMASSYVSDKESSTAQRSTRSKFKKSEASITEVKQIRRALRSASGVQNDSSGMERRLRSRTAASSSSSVATSTQKSKKVTK